MMVSFEGKEIILIVYVWMYGCMASAELCREVTSYLLRNPSYVCLLWIVLHPWCDLSHILQILQIPILKGSRRLCITE